MKTVLVFLLLSGTAYCDEMKLVGYEEVKDCKFPPQRIVIGYDEHNLPIVVIKQDDRCE